MTKPALLAAALALTLSGKIFYSAAPWDEAAYDIRLPLSSDADGEAISVMIWGNPKHDRKITYSFSGHEDPGGGPGKGKGRASYQEKVGKSWPIRLQGRLTFNKLLPDQPVTGAFQLRTSDRKKSFNGTFTAEWSGQPLRRIP